MVNSVEPSTNRAAAAIGQLVPDAVRVRPRATLPKGRSHALMGVRFRLCRLVGKRKVARACGAISKSGVPDDTPQQRIAAEVDAPVLGSLCTGYGGLDLGVLAAYGSGRIAWCADPTPTSANSWPRGCLGCRIWVTCARSTGPASNRSMFSPQDSPAKTSPPGGEPGSRREPAVVCGPTSWTAFAYYDRRAARRGERRRTAMARRWAAPSTWRPGRSRG